jgi:hypothetical protein
MLNDIIAEPVASPITNIDQKSTFPKYSGSRKRYGIPYLTPILFRIKLNKTIQYKRKR